MHQLHEHHAEHSDGAHHPPLATPFRALVRWSATGPVVVLSGEVDLCCAEQLGALRDLLQRHGQRAVVDTSEVAFMDVGGLRALLALAGDGGSLLVLRPSAAVLRLLDLLAGTATGLSVVRAGPREEALVLRETTVASDEGHGPPGTPRAPRPRRGR
ncbi:anti-anti-sigma factor [Quadrisphaera granulorum]|uniref:Anti-anti-sigma factor n=1 Tax=Quadrisphaera granulorum TaxID=317664 RepID=A0A316A5C1_9ACTN|nr:STAS domain-containing protein [Quadrisphaera granulorum]PWJ52672.1 anti-anti-sigma factor [Quadrisphaera granulorum]SZE97494.1 anti-anti-sigma factor [Quadrisphaera granulorum]